MEDEARDILGEPDPADDQQPRRLGSWFAELFNGVGLTEDIEDLHGESVRPLDLEERSSIYRP